MGSPLAPILANLFMGYHEKSWLENYKDSKISIYRRYVDDIFCLFDNEHDAMLFFDYINAQHPNIKFTHEKQLNGKLPFLDVLVDNSSNICHFFRKYFQFHTVNLQNRPNSHSS